MELASCGRASCALYHQRYGVVSPLTWVYNPWKLLIWNSCTLVYLNKYRTCRTCYTKNPAHLCWLCFSGSAKKCGCQGQALAILALSIESDKATQLVMNGFCFSLISASLRFFRRTWNPNQVLSTSSIVFQTHVWSFILLLAPLLIPSILICVRLHSSIFWGLPGT